MASSNQLVLASNNSGKLKEFQHIFSQAGLNFEVLPQSNFSVSDADETGLSFIENAILKARHASKQTGLPALADDSGLAVPLLGGAPGIYSARYAGTHGNDTANNQKLLTDLLPHRQQHTNIPAYFVCVLAMIKHAEDPLPIVVQGLWHGEILEKHQGDNGFGYDPLFWVPSLQKTSAQLSPEEKNTLSHRAIASKRLIEKLLQETANTN